MSFRWEEDLRNSFQEHAQHTLWSRPKAALQLRTVRESACSEGRADLVWASMPRAWPNGLPREVADLLQQPTCSRILALLKPQAFRSEPFLLARTGVAVRTFRQWLGELIQVGLITDLGAGRFILGPHFSIPEIEICSFEFKLANWKRAFYQATRYRTFSHRVFVVMPPESLSPALAHTDVFRRFNVGLLSHDVEGRSERILPSRKQKPTARHRFITALGMFSA